MSFNPKKQIGVDLSTAIPYHITKFVDPMAYAKEVECTGYIQRFILPIASGIAVAAFEDEDVTKSM